MYDNPNNDDEKRKLSGEELKSLMFDGKLSEGYISEENILTLLGYEIERMRIVSLEYSAEQMKNSNLYDLDLIIYCTDILVRRYRNSDEFSSVNEWDNLLARARNRMQDIDKNSEETAKEFVMKMFEALEPRMRADEEQLKRSAEKFEKLLEESERKRRQLKLIFTLRKHVIAFMIACAIMLPIALIAFNTNLFGNIADFTREMFQNTKNNEAREDDMARVGFDTGIYSSIEEFEAAHDVSLMVPRWLPGDLEVENIVCLKERLEITYNYGLALVRIDFNTNIPNTYGAEIHENNGSRFYIFKDANILRWEYDGNLYNLSFVFDIGEYVIRIIENIK